MSKLRRLLEQGFSEGLLSDCECMTQDEIFRAARDMSIADFQAMVNEGRLERCPRHPEKFRASVKALKEAVRLIGRDPEIRRRLG